MENQIDYSKLSDQELQDELNRHYLDKGFGVRESTAATNAPDAYKENQIRQKIKSLKDMGYSGLSDQEFRNFAQESFVKGGGESADLNRYKDIMYNKNKSQYSDLLKNAQGWDKEGNLVVGDLNTGEFNKLDKKDFENVYRYANETNYGKDNSFEKKYEDWQAKELTKDKKYLGQDTEGNSVFQNQAGIVERAKGSFSEGLKRQFGEIGFDKSKIGSSNQQINENKIIKQHTGQMFTKAPGVGQENKQTVQLGIATKKPKTPMYSTPNNSTELTQEKKAATSSPVLTPTKVQSNQQGKQSPEILQAFQQGLQNQLNPEISSAEKAAKQKAQPAIANIKQQASDYGKSLIDQYIPSEYKDVYNQNQGIIGAISNPQEFAKNQVVDMAKNYLTSSYGGGVGSTGAQVLSTALSGGNLEKSLSNLAVNNLKDSTTNYLTSNLLGSTPGGAGAALDVGKALLSNGTAKEKGNAATQAALRAALASSTGGLSEFINPTTLSLTSSGLSNIKNSQSLNNMGVAGDILKGTLGLTAGVGNTASDAGQRTLNVAGNAGGDFFSTQSNALKGVKDAVKNLTSGNVGEGLKGLASTGLKSAYETLIKNPVNTVTNVVKNVSGFISNLFCFAPGTEIIMKDGSVKKIEDINVGDEIALGGLVTAIGQAIGTEFVVINGVHVVDTHALYEDGEWIRAKDSKNISEKYSKPDSIVYPIATQHHLVVTKGQIWADTFEHDNQQDMTKKEILKDLNKDKRLNKILDIYLKVRGWA